MPPLVGLFSWLMAGIAAAFLARAFLPGQPRLGLAAVLIVGPGSALAGGILATVLGFGGLGAFDPRSLVTATLTAALGLLLLRGAWLQAPANEES